LFSTPRKKRWTLIVGALLLLGAFANTMYFWLHFTPNESASDTIALDEQRAGVIIANHPGIPVYTFEYNFWDTLSFYSGGRYITKLTLDQGLSQPVLLVASSEYMEYHSFSPDLISHFAPIYSGPALTLYYFSP
jgi:hypothetical protein